MPGVGDKINGAIQMAHGIGDQIRGSLMETLDTSLASLSNPSAAAQNPSSDAPITTTGASKNAELWNKGKEEYSQGRARLAGHNPNPSQSANVGGQEEVVESDRPPIQPREGSKFGHGDQSVGTVPGGGR